MYEAVYKTSVSSVLHEAVYKTSNQLLVELISFPTVGQREMLIYNLKSTSVAPVRMSLNKNHVRPVGELLCTFSYESHCMMPSVSDVALVCCIVQFAHPWQSSWHDTRRLRFSV